VNKLINGLFLAGVTFGAGLGSAMAASDFVDVTANVLEVITVDAAGNYNTFDVTPGTAVVDQDIATITIHSNDPDGYEVTLTGTHDTSILVNAGGTQSLPYTVKYAGGTAIGITDTATSVESVTDVTGGEVERSLTLSIEADDTIGKAAVAYTDTITVEILGL
jgi:hypothetical protein